MSSTIRSVEVVEMVEGLSNRQKEVFRRRLVELANVLRRLKKGQFEMTGWVDTHTWEGKKDLSCGTSACVLGWATTIPSLRRAGLRMFATTDDGTELEEYEGAHAFVPFLVDPRNPKQVVSIGGLYHCHEIGQRLFGLENWESHELFLEGMNATPKEKAREVMALAKQFKVKPQGRRPGGRS